MKDQRINVEMENIAQLNTTPSDLIIHGEERPKRQINPYKFIGRIGLLLFIIFSAWVAFTYPIIWWGTVGVLFGAVGLLTVKERFTHRPH